MEEEEIWVRQPLSLDLLVKEREEALDRQYNALMFLIKMKIPLPEGYRDQKGRYTPADYEEYLKEHLCEKNEVRNRKRRK